MKKPILLPILSIAVCAAMLLGLSFGLSGVAARNAQAAHLERLKLLLPGSETFTVEPYAGEDANIRSVHKGENGFVIETVTQGYVEEITMFIGVSLEGKVTGLVVQQAYETVGLGNESLTDHVFLSQFLNKGGSFAVSTAAEGADIGIDGITGATVTSKAIVRCVNSAVAYVTGADVVSTATEWEA